MTEVTIVASKDGPYEVRGPATVLSPQGRVLRAGTVMFLCRCGLSANKPFCDGTHVRAGFRSDPDAPASGGVGARGGA